MNLFSAAGNAKGEGSAHLGIASYELQKGHFDAALEEANEAIELFLGVAEKKKAAVAWTFCSFAHKGTGKFDDAVQDLMKGKRLLQQVSDGLGEASSWLSVAEVRTDSGEHEKALCAARQARELAKGLRGRRQKKVLRDVVQVMTRVHIDKQEPEEAAQVAHEGELLTRKESTYLEQAQMKLLAANTKREHLWKEAENADEANAKRLRRLYEDTLRKTEGAVKLARSAEDPGLLAEALHALGYMCYYGFDSAEGLKHAEEGLAIFRDREDKLGELRCMLLVAQTQSQLGERSKATEILDEAKTAAKAYGDEEFKKVIADMLEEIKIATPVVKQMVMVEASNLAGGDAGAQSVAVADTFTPPDAS